MLSMELQRRMITIIRRGKKNLLLFNKAETQTSLIKLTQDSACKQIFWQYKQKTKYWNW